MYNGEEELRFSQRGDPHLDPSKWVTSSPPIPQPLIGGEDAKLALRDLERELGSLENENRSKKRTDQKSRGLKSMTSLSTRTSSVNRRSSIHKKGDEPASDEDELEPEEQRRLSFNLVEYFRTEQEEKARSGILGKHVGLLFENLSVVYETRINTRFPNVSTALISLINPHSLVKSLLKRVYHRAFLKENDTYVIREISGIVKHGEMCLVLGRPGSGCTTFLKVVSMIHNNIKRVEGTLELAGIDMNQFSSKFRGEALYNPDFDGHIPILKVWQTLDLALRFKTPGRRAIGVTKLEFRRRVLALLLRIFRMGHIKDSIVGNEYIRGISGGERRRLTIAEMLSSGNALSCWDNLTNGLDSSTAHEVVRSLKVLTMVTNTTTIAYLSQVSEQIYKCFDKVMLLDKGRLIYFGPTSKACSYFEALGYVRDPTETEPGFLMGIVDINTRKFNQDFDIQTIPSTAEQLAQVFRDSFLYAELLREMNDYRAQIASEGTKSEFVRAVLDSKSRFLSKKSTFTVSFLRQVEILYRRASMIINQDKFDRRMSILILIIVSLIIGTTFFKLELSARGLFVRGSLFFITVCFNGLQSYAEMIEVFQNRFLIYRHKSYRFYSPSANQIASICAKTIPIIVRLLIFMIIVYPMTGLTVGKRGSTLVSFFFMLLLLSYTTTALFRAIAGFCKNFSVATRLASVIIGLMVLFSGFMIPGKILGDSVKWIHTINPLQCAFTNLMLAEFDNIHGVSCSESDLVPTGPGYDDSRYKFCSLSGSSNDNQTVSLNGDQYLNIVFGMEMKIYWVNVAILLISFFIFTGLSCLSSELFDYGEASSKVILYKKCGKSEIQLNKNLERRRKDHNDKLLVEQGLKSYSDLKNSQSFKNISTNVYMPHTSNLLAADTSLKSRELSNDSTKQTSVNDGKSPRTLLWRDISYKIQLNNAERVLTDHVTGYAKQGTLTALMGASGAGKTTFLDIIAGRKTTGIITGEMSVDGIEFSGKNSKMCAYCEQLDILFESSTVREALRFSAYLRQNYVTPISEKNEFVEELIYLLELEPFADAIIGNSMIGTGIGPGQRKLTTIGIELASKPAFLLLLDEPTSGLDNKSANDIVRFLKKLSQLGLAVICTIHQPNTAIFEQFDNLILMMAGGKLAYFGEVGPRSETVLDYFKSRGAVFDSNLSPPEFIIDVLEPSSTIPGAKKDWADEWKKSLEFKKINETIDELKNKFADDRTSMKFKSYEEEVKFIPAPWIYQFRLATKRELVRMWRSPDYCVTRIVNHIFFAVTNILAFGNAPSTPSGIQSRTFALAQLIAFGALILNHAQPRFILNKMIFGRESSVGTYTKEIFALSSIISELPLSIFCGTLYMLLFYFPSGFKSSAEHFFFALLASNLAELFTVTFAQVLGSLVPSVYLASKFVPCFLIIFNLYSGVTAPYPSLPSALRYTLYWANPFRWLVASVIEKELPGNIVTCTDRDFSVFNPPPGKTCEEYMGPFIKMTKSGYIENPLAVENCKFCKFSSGEEFMGYLQNLDGSHAGRDLAIFSIFILTNIIFIVIATKYMKSASR